MPLEAYSPLDILEALNPPQRAAATHSGGPLLILAGPGSGKTRVITHRIAYLIRELGVPPYRILAVTFTNKAAREMKERLRESIGPSASSGQAPATGSRDGESPSETGQAPSTSLSPRQVPFGDRSRQVEEVTMGTFHSVCVRILRAEAERHGLDRRFVIYDSDDQLNLIKQCLEDLNVDTRKFSPRAVQGAIGQAKSQLIGPQDYAALSYFDEVVRRVYTQYQAALAEAKAVDFDDLIMRTVQLFRDTPEVLEKYQTRYLHVLIDEFQDTNVAQYAWARLLAGKHRNICVVGDPDQSIYSWRSADIKNILNFEQDYPDAKVVYLEENYRSSKTILEAASHLIATNRQRKEVRLWTRNDAGLPITFREGYDEEEEAWFVAQELERLTLPRGQASKPGPYRWGSCAVMYRTNAQSRALEEAMVRAGIPYKLVGATRFYARREIRDLVAYLRLVQNPYDSLSLQRVINVPGRGIGHRTVEELGRRASRLGVPLYTAIQLEVEPHEENAKTEDRPRFSPRTLSALQRFLQLLNELAGAAESEPTVSLVDLLLARLDYRSYLLNVLEDGEERWENVQELRAVSEQFSDLKPLAGLEAFLESIALVSDVDNMEEQAEAVTLITLHQAKGLEFPVVFIVGMEEGVFPHIRSFDDPAQMEEERRLAYVGVTRAKERLYLLRAFRRSIMGSRMPNPPSRFLQDIPPHLIEAAPRAGPRTAASWSSPVPAAFMQRMEPAPLPTALPTEPLTASFQAGEHVRHQQFGEGIVVSCEPSRTDEVVTVAFKGSVGVKRLMLSYAPLEKLA